MHPERLYKHLLCVFLLCLGFAIPTAYAQVPPGDAESSRYTGLHLAAFQGDVDATRRLIEEKADLEARDNAGRTPIIIAAFASHENVVRMLRDAGADINAFEYRAYDVVTIASVANDLPMLELALELGASAANVTSPYEGTALIAAAHLGYHQIVKRLIEAQAPLDHINNLHWTALIEAVVLGDGGPDHIKTAKLLIDAGADQSIGDRSGVTAREHAVSRGYSEMVELFN